jgi:hypothetical protein
MVRTRVAVWIAAAFLSHAGMGWCQTPGTPNPTETTPTPHLAPYVLPPVEQSPAIQPIVAPFVDTSPVGSPGFFGDVDLNFLRPHLNSHFSGSVGTDTVVLTTEGTLGTVLSPWFVIGYRQPEQLGEYRLAYRFETAERDFVPTDNLGGIAEKDRLNLNLVDLDWGHWSPFALESGWDLYFHVGARVATIFFDTRRAFAPPGNDAGQLAEQASSNFWGLGPEAGFAVTRELFVPGLAVVGSVTGAQLFGDIHQHFSETTVAGGGPAFGSDGWQVGPTMLTVQAALSYCPPGWEGWHFSAGFIWEEFWQIGRLRDANADLSNRGLFLQVQFDF